MVSVAVSYFFVPFLTLFLLSGFVLGFFLVFCLQTLVPNKLGPKSVLCHSAPSRSFLEAMNKDRGFFLFPLIHLQHKKKERERERTKGRKSLDKSSRKTWGSWFLTKVLLAALLPSERAREESSARAR